MTVERGWRQTGVRVAPFAGSGSVSLADGEESMPASFNQEILPSRGYVSGKDPVNPGETWPRCRRKETPSYYI